MKELRKRQKENKRYAEDDNAWVMKRKKDTTPRSDEGGSPASSHTPLQLNVLKITPDGRCMFRALVQGMATNNVNDMLTGREEV